MRKMHFTARIVPKPPGNLAYKFFSQQSEYYNLGKFGRQSESNNGRNFCGVYLIWANFFRKTVDFIINI
jgi:hypothetical protein